MKRTLAPSLALAAILLLAGALRWVGINWDDYNHSHPDELFLTTIVTEVGERRELLDDVRQQCAADPRRNHYFNTACTPLNPNNIEEGSFAYGTLPVFIVRGAAEAVAALTGDEHWTSFDGAHLVGRGVNIVADLIAVALVYLIGRRLLGVRPALVAALLYACAALPIQLAHYWTVDTQANLWLLVALYAAVRVSQGARAPAYALFGIALGAGVASRINIALAAPLLPLAAALAVYPRLEGTRWATDRRRWQRTIGPAAGLVVLAALLAVIVFRVGQPYAFRGPTFWGVELNPKWLDDMEYVSNLSSARSDGWPPSHQFVDRTAYAYPWFNMAIWGMGPLLGLAATLGLIGAVINQVRHYRVSAAAGLLTAWTLIYFAWHGRLHFATMRYFLPLYGALALIAVWWLGRLPGRWRRWARGAVVVGTCAWAFAFTAIYRAPQTRVEAAQWMRDAVPASFAARTAEGETVPLATGGSQSLRMVTLYRPPEGSPDGEVRGKRFQLGTDDRVEVREIRLKWVEPTPISARLELVELAGAADPAPIFERAVTETEPGELIITLEEGERFLLWPGSDYRWTLHVEWDGPYERLHLIPSMLLGTADGGTTHAGIRLDVQDSVEVPFVLIDEAHGYRVEAPDEDLVVSALWVAHSIGGPADLLATVAGAQHRARLAETDGSASVLGEGRWYALDEPVRVAAGETILLEATTPQWISGTTVATEGTWDFSTPSRTCLREAGARLGLLPRASCVRGGGFDDGWYVELPLEVVEPDSAAKLRRMADVLEKADYLTISSNRMYDALPRNEARYPAMGAYYDALFGGRLGYAQAARFVSFPRLGPLTIPDQALPDRGLPGWANGLEAEEAFTVYDHPTIYVFEHVTFARDQMPAFVPWDDPRSRVDLDAAAETTYTAPVTDPDAGAEWGMVLLAALGLTALGWATFPLLFAAAPGLPLRGYALGRGLAWLLLALVPWWVTAVTGWRAWTRAGLIAAAAALIALGAAAAWRHRAALGAYLRAHWRALLLLDAAWLALLGVGLLLRGVDPDYWHPWLGGEKHMDLAYLNAVWRTGQFPPPNPWLSGYTINYYYFGFVIAAAPLKLFGTVPEIGANLALALLYATVGVQVLSLALGALAGAPARWRAALGGLAVLLVMVAGNYGTLKMLIDGGLVAHHRWYWYPTRVLTESANRGGGIVNEVPFFSFLYGDPHAHVFGLLPVTLLLAAVWALARDRRVWLAAVCGALLGVLYMTNTWDILVYVPLVGLVALAAGWRERRWPLWLALAGGAALLTAWPYMRGSALGQYSALERWTAERSLLGPFLLMWGGPLAVIGVWLAHRVKARLAPDADAPVTLGVLLLLIGPAVAVGGEGGTSLLLGMALTLALALAASDGPQRLPHLAAAFFLAGLLAIEHVVVQGDVGRMNTGFKVSLQLWVWAGVLIPVLLWRMASGRRALLPLAFSVVALLPGFLYPLKALPARSNDAYTDAFALDGYAFMDVMRVDTPAGPVLLDEDVALIRHLRATEDGYPVIVEAYDREYYWNSRIASYTGLPGVVGWQNHLRQQYPYHTDEIDRRVRDVQAFYTTASAVEMRAILARYGADYVVWGRLEQSMSGGEQAAALGELVAAGELSAAYEAGETVLYRVERTG